MTQNTAVPTQEFEDSQFITKKMFCRLTGLSGETLKRYRRTGTWIEGIHWIKLNNRLICYNWPLIKDWFQNSHDPAAHQRAIEAYQASLLSNQPRQRGRKRKT